MSAEQVEIENDEKIIVTKKKRQVSENQLKALEKARNMKAIKKEAIKIVNTPTETIKYVEKRVEKSNDNFFLMGLVGLTAIVATYVITTNKSIISNTLNVMKNNQDTEKDVKEETEAQISLQEPLKKVSRCSNLVLEF
jgi:hypothetical protein